jgi:hypothetical protein
MIRYLSCSVALLAALSACGSDGVPGECALSFNGSTNADFGDPGIDGLIEATGKFKATAGSLDSSVRDACNGISSDLGGTTNDDTAVACDNAVAQIDSIFTANANVSIVLEYAPPVCSAGFAAIVACAAQCDADFDAVATPPTCDGGELSGTCSGACDGECTVEGSAACAGDCSATCTGTCSATVVADCTGTCTGQCDGTCATTDADGNCAGDCDGTCRGTCSGSIDGTCSGQCNGDCSGACRADVAGSCSGTCSGMCDVAFQEPTCEGGDLEVEASADCQASCEAEASFDVECTEPTVVVSYSGAASSSADLDALVATLEANFGAILEVTGRLSAIANATTALATRLAGAATAAANLGLEASDCVRLAIEAQVEAAASIQVSVQASASVSGSVAAGTN